MALPQLRETRSDLLCARLSALQINLTGARAQRGAELLEKIADAIAHAERLLTGVIRSTTVRWEAVLA